MILCNVELHSALDAKRLVITPEPSPRVPTEGQYCPYDTHSVDLKLGQEVVIPEEGPYSYDLMQSKNLGAFIRKNSERTTIHPRSGFALGRNQFVLANTHEFLHLPIPANAEICLAARIEGKSSLARCGVVVHFTAPTVHPGFEGNLTLEIINLGPVPFVLRAGMPIAQLIVEEVKGIPIFKKKSQFHGQTSPEGTK